MKKVKKIIVIANERNSVYEKPVAYVTKDNTYVTYIENGQVCVNENDKQIIKIDQKGCYEPFIFVKNDIIFFGFGIKGGGVNVINIYSYELRTQTLKKLYNTQPIISSHIEDFRFVVDNDYNIHGTFCVWQKSDRVQQYELSLYAGNSEMKAFDGRGKHGDIAVTKNGKYVFVVWQSRQDKGYVIALQKKENKFGGKWSMIQIVSKGEVQRPRILIVKNITHVIHHEGIDPDPKIEGSGRVILYRNSKDNFKTSFEVSEIGRKAGYGSIDISGYDDKNLLISMRKNKEIQYNEMVNGVWKGAETLVKMNPDTQSCFFIKNLKTFVFTNKNEEVVMVQDDYIEKDIEEEIEPETDTLPEIETEPAQEVIEKPKFDDEKLKNNVIPKMKIELHTKKIFRFTFKEGGFPLKIDFKMIWKLYKSQIILFIIGLIVGVIL